MCVEGERGKERVREREREKEMDTTIDEWVRILEDMENSLSRGCVCGRVNFFAGGTLCFFPLSDVRKGTPQEIIEVWVYYK
jgi:hypothetical protein